MTQQSRELKQRKGEQSPAVISSGMSRREHGSSTDPASARFSDTSGDNSGDAPHGNGTGGDTGNRTAPLCVVVAETLDRYFDDLEGTPPAHLYDLVMQEVEKPLLRKVMDYTRGNQSRAAEVLGINRSTLRKKLRIHDLA